jgi:hypothetical protein
MWVAAPSEARKSTAGAADRDDAALAVPGRAETTIVPAATAPAPRSTVRRGISWVTGSPFLQLDSVLPAESRSTQSSSAYRRLDRDLTEDVRMRPVPVATLVQTRSRL